VFGGEPLRQLRQCEVGAVAGLSDSAALHPTHIRCIRFSHAGKTSGQGVTCQEPLIKFSPSSRAYVIRLTES
jgi:hypothetical protein